MNNKIYLNAGIALLAALGLAACNGGNSTSTSNNAPQTSELQQYINSLAYTPANGKGLTGGADTHQQSFSTPGGLTINSVEIKFYSGENCTGLIANHTLAGSVTPAAGTYTSTNKSNNALCTNYVNDKITPNSSGCSGLYEDMSKGNMRSVQYTYNIDNGSGGSYPIVAGCMYNPNAVVTIGEDTTTGVEGIANWTDADACSGSGNTTCGYSQPYAVSLGAAASFFRPMQVVLNNAGTYAYVVDLGFSDGVVLKCTVDQATGGFVGSCINMNVAGLNQSWGITLESQGRYGYITSSANSTIKKCDINLSGDFVNCGDSGVGNNLVPNPFGIIQSNSTVYIAGGNFIWGCAMDDLGVLSNCQQVNTDGIGQALPGLYLANGGDNYPTGFFATRVVNSQGTFQLKRCPYDSYGITCNDAYDNMGIMNTKPVGVAVSGTKGYMTYMPRLPMSDGHILACYIDGDNSGNFVSCSDFTDPALTDPQQITINSAGTIAYIANASYSNVVACPLDGSGVPMSCSNAQP